MSKLNQRFFVKALLLALGLFLMGLALWTNKYFDRVTVDQALATISFGVNSVISADSIFLRRFVEWCLIWPSILFVVMLALMRLQWMARLPYFILALGVMMVSYQYQLPGYLLNFFQGKDDVFKRMYVDPQTVSIKGRHTKNLIIIYVESLESTYSNSALFDHDLLAGLNKATSGDAHFSDYQQMPGTSWTIAGIVSTQCGIPLKLITIFNGNHMGENASNFLSGATCLSDILASHGYRNVFMKGGDLAFAGVDEFLKSHHYSESYGRTEWERAGYKGEDMAQWGLSDASLFQQAKVKLTELMKSKQPFNLTILTVDMHGFGGKLNPACRKQGFRGFAGVVECTADEVADFVKFVKRKKWLNQVTILIQGDHLAMKNTLSDKLELEKSRRIYNAILNDKPIHKNTEDVVHFDMLPTILDILGFKYPGGKLGLGYSSVRQPRPAESPDRIDTLSVLADRHSEAYNQLWTLPARI